MEVEPGSAVGGPFLGVHWRRNDFLKVYAKKIPSIKGAADQIAALLDKLGLDTVFVGTDGKPKGAPKAEAHIRCQSAMKGD